MVTEMARISTSEMVRVELEFLRGLPDACFLKSIPDRICAEVLSSRGSDASVFLSPNMQSALLNGATRMPEMWDAERMLLAEQQQAFVEEETAIRKGVLDSVGGQENLAGKIKDWFADPVKVTADAARAFMRRNHREFVLGEDENEWPQPESLPTVWGMSAYRAARTYLLNRDGRRIDANDFQDWGHYAAAMHADLLVTSDAKFRAVVAFCPPPKPRTVSFEDWVAEISGPDAPRTS